MTANTLTMNDQIAAAVRISSDPNTVGLVLALQDRVERSRDTGASDAVVAADPGVVELLSRLQPATPAES